MSWRPICSAQQRISLIACRRESLWRNGSWG